MEIKHHNKLVRDGILLELTNKGVDYTHAIVKGEQLIRALITKLGEEVGEVIQAQSAEEIIEELADVVEVCYALAKQLGDKYGYRLEMNKVRKLHTKGGFDTGSFLLTTKRGEQ